MYIAILGRQPELSIAEIERVYGQESITPISPQAALVDSPAFDVNLLGGTQKAGRVVFETDKSDWPRLSKKIAQHCVDDWSNVESKITLGISAYGFDIDPRIVQKTGIIIKQILRKRGVSLRLIPNSQMALNTAASHHNKLGLTPNKQEILVVRTNGGKAFVAESIGAQNISAYAARDQKRPKRDARVGMLPPKLAQIMINLAVGTADVDTSPAGPTILDPFCGTGVILQEAALMGYSVYGTDSSEKMIRYSRDNINWLADLYKTKLNWYLHEGDATDMKWRQPINAVVSEAYLGQPFNSPPSSVKLAEVRGDCNLIITKFLKNIATQIPAGTPLCLAVPAWRGDTGRLTHLPLIDDLQKLGFKRHEFKNASNHKLIYFREDQVVARELLVLTRS